MAIVQRENVRERALNDDGKVEARDSRDAWIAV